MCLLVGISFILVINQRLPDTLRSKWNLAHTYTCSIEDGVRYRRRSSHHRGLSRAHCWLVRTVYQHDFYFRYLGKVQDWIRLPINTSDSSFVELDFFLKRPTKRLDDAPFNLIFHAIGVDDQSTIVCKDDTFHSHHSRAFLHVYLSNTGHDSLIVLITSKCHSAPFPFGQFSLIGARRSTWVPAGFLRGSNQDHPLPRISQIT